MSDVTQGMSLAISTLAGGEIEVTAGADAETWAHDTEINATSATRPEIPDSCVTLSHAGGRGRAQWLRAPQTRRSGGRRLRASS